MKKFLDFAGLSKFKKKILEAMQSWVGKQGFLTQHQDLSSITSQLTTMNSTLNAIKTKLDAYPTMVAADGCTYAFIDGKLVKIAEKTEDVATVTKS